MYPAVTNACADTTCSVGSSSDDCDNCVEITEFLADLAENYENGMYDLVGFLQVLYRNLKD